MDVTTLLLKQMEGYGKSLWQETELVLKRGDFLGEQGKINTNVYWVTQGALHLYYETEAGSNTIRFAYNDSLFALLDSLITGTPTAYTVQAIRKTKLRVMSGNDFMEFINSSTETLKLWNTILSYTVIAQLERETDLLNPSPKERYEKVLKRSPKLFKEVPHKYIASYLRMAPETLSRLQKS
jgi:CRP-like cAMP-binding protein